MGIAENILYNMQSQYTIQSDPVPTVWYCCAHSFCAASSSTVLLFYCSTALLFYCSTVLLSYCSTVLLFYCISRHLLNSFTAVHLCCFLRCFAAIFRRVHVDFAQRPSSQLFCSVLFCSRRMQWSMAAAGLYPNPDKWPANFRPAAVAGRPAGIHHPTNTCSLVIRNRHPS